MQDIRLGTDERGSSMPAGSRVDNVVVDQDGGAFYVASPRQRETPPRGVAALRQNLRVTPFKFESLIGWIAAMISLVVAVKLFE